jgi:hypothetical protein
MKLKIFIFIILLYSCNSNQDRLLEYKAEKLQTDESIEKFSLIPVDTLILEENEDVILQDISSAAVSQNSKYLAVASPPSKQLIIYNYINGKIIKYFYSGSNLSDSVALSKRKPSKWSFSEKLSKYNWEFITINKLVENGRKMEDTIRIINNMYADAKFISNSLYCNVIVYIPCVNGTHDNYLLGESTTIIVEYDLNNIKSLVIPESNDSVCSLPSDFLFTKNVIMTSSDFVRQFTYKKIDSLITLVEYDKYTGDIIDVIGYLPDSYINSKAGYNLWWKPKLTSSANEVYIAYPHDNFIYKKYNKKRFELKNLPFSNKYGFDNFEDYMKIDFLEKKDLSRKEIINKLFPVVLISLFNYNGHLLMIYQITDPNKESYYLLQEYTSDGKLLRQGNYENDQKNPIQNFVYDETNQYLLIFRKNNEGWNIQRNKI